MRMKNLILFLPCWDFWLRTALRSVTNWARQKYFTLLNRTNDLNLETTELRLIHSKYNNEFRAESWIMYKNLSGGQNSSNCPSIRNNFVCQAQWSIILTPLGHNSKTFWASNISKILKYFGIMHLSLSYAKRGVRSFWLKSKSFRYTCKVDSMHI